MSKKIIICNTTRPEGDSNYVKIAVHPFFFEGTRNGYTAKEMADALHGKLLVTLWGALPGCQFMSVSNGEISFRHSGTHSKAQVFEIAEDVIRKSLAS